MKHLILTKETKSEIKAMLDGMVIKNFNFDALYEKIEEKASDNQFNNEIGSLYMIDKTPFTFTLNELDFNSEIIEE
jgi:hypothetical protein